MNLIKGLDHHLDTIEKKIDTVMTNQNIISHEYTSEFYHAPKNTENEHTPESK